jgi:hypothetical protein
MSAPIQSLAEWLDTATEKLSRPAKERIKLEIKSHFEDAVETHRAEELTEAQAQARSLTDLGDAKAAAKRFQKNHLTELEAKRLEATLSSYQRWSRSLWMNGFSYVFGTLFFAGEDYLFEKHHVPLVLPGVSTMAGLILSTISLWIARHHDFRSSLRLLFTLDMLNRFNVLMFFGFYGAWVSWVPFCTILLIFSSPKMVGEFRLWLKIQKMDDIWQEMPPPDAAVP